MLIGLSKLDEGKGSFAHEYEPDVLDLADERVRLASRTTVSGRARRTSGRVVVEGKIESGVEIECDRCLKSIRLPVETGFSLEYISSSDYQSTNAAELAEEDMDVSVFDGETIDIDEIVREQILLAVPARVLCVEDCKGICATCGTDLNAGDCNCESQDVDPRWSALKSLRTNK